MRSVMEKLSCAGMPLVSPIAKVEQLAAMQ